MTHEDGRYELLRFPSYLGSPVLFDSYIAARLYACALMVMGHAELRIVDRKTGEHIWVW